MDLSNVPPPGQRVHPPIGAQPLSISFPLPFNNSQGKGDTGGWVPLLLPFTLYNSLAYVFCLPLVLALALSLLFKFLAFALLLYPQQGRACREGRSPSPYHSPFPSLNPRGRGTQGDGFHLPSNCFPKTNHAQKTPLKFHPTRKLLNINITG